jgi:hypothetical protein
MIGGISAAPTNPIADCNQIMCCNAYIGTVMLVSYSFTSEKMLRAIAYNSGSNLIN